MEESGYLCHPRVLAFSASVNFNAADERVVRHRREGNHNLPARIRRCGELLDVGDVLPHRGLHDVEVRQHLSSLMLTLNTREPAVVK